MRILCKTLVLAMLINTDVLAQESVTIRIDPSSAKGGNAADYFSSVNFIPLETTNESIFGKIYKMELTEKYIYIHDVETNALLIFYKNGKFHKKISPVKNKYVGDFSVDEKGNQLTILTSDKITTYSLDGVKREEVEKPEGVERLFRFDDNSFAFNVSRSLTFTTENKIKYDVEIVKDKSARKQLFGYNAKFTKYDYNLPRDVFSNQGDGTCWFTFPYRYEANHLNADGVLKSYKMVFPQEYSLPQNFDTDSAFTDKRKSYIFSPDEEDTKQFKSFNPFFSYKDKLIFHAENISGHWGLLNNNLIYDINSGELISLNSIVGDRISSNIPILYPKFAQQMHAFRKGALYTSIPSFMLLKLISQDRGNIPLPPSLIDFSKVKNSHSNPIIIESFIK